ncbi:hypothetical protein CCGE531_17240 [Rhizobium sp. CCGE531]|nr:hypothetical protein CCGE531_17240 [Rhizobium sp. CCGE531]AYG73965.1 hypothetical protein CCGE532_16745 [Rhizobium sp. CCGE532]
MVVVDYQIKYVARKNTLDRTSWNDQTIDFDAMIGKLAKYSTPHLIFVNQASTSSKAHPPTIYARRKMVSESDKHKINCLFRRLKTNFKYSKG